LEILLTGAFGSVGLYTLKELIKKGNRVSVLELKTRTNQKIFESFKQDIEIFWGDITDRNTVAKAVAGKDVVIHLAFVIPSRSEDRPNWSWEINVEGTRNILNAMRSSPDKSRIVFASSVSVFGNTQKSSPPRTSAEQVMPTDNYTHHKVACEQLVKISGLDWTILRIGAVLSASFCEIDPMLFDVPLDTRIEVIHAHDAGIAFAAAALSEDVWGKILLIGGGPDCQIYQRDLVKKVLEAVGIGMLPEKAFASKSFYTDWMDTTESQKLLNYQNLMLDDYINDIKNSMGFKRYLTRLARPLIRYWLLRKSPYLVQKEADRNNTGLKVKGKILTDT
jgi:UDP-glucose 4-epimerase